MGADRPYTPWDLLENERAPLSEVAHGGGIKMKRQGWHILREGAALTLCRQAPARFDVAVSVELPAGDPLRLAHQVRQDMWRKLQSLRGFSPVVEVTPKGHGLRVRAGGQVLGRVPSNAAGLITDVLENPLNRARWLRHANRVAKRPRSVQSQVNLHKSSTGFDKEGATGS